MTRTWYYDNNKSNDQAAGPVPQSAITMRRLLSIPAIVLLWTAAMPFTPVGWLLGGIEGAFLFDRFIAGVILLCALYFQFSFSSLTYPVAVAFPNPLSSSQSDTYISGGRMRSSAYTYKGNSNPEITFYYHPENYYTYVAAEMALLVVAEFGGMEYLRRVVVLAIVGALWAVGWMITPRRTKMWAWGHIKTFWFFIVLDLIRDVGFGGGRRRGRR